MTDTPSSSLRQRAAGLAASGLVLASMLLTPASALAAGGPGTPPDLFPDTITTPEETPASGNVLTNDVNSSGVVPFTVTTYSQPVPGTAGTLVIAADGAYTFTPAPNFTGTATATYNASNTKHDVGPAQITINVTNVQDPPVAGDDTVTVVEDTATNVKSAILANDSDPDGDTLSVTGATGATGGGVDLTGGAVTFTPTGNLCGAGAGSFDYTLSATGGTDTAHVTVNITCVDDAPHAVNDNASGTEDMDVLVDESTLIANDTDVENDTLSVTGVSNASGGTVSRSGGTVTFTPDANLCGNNSASFNYTVSDGTASDSGKVTIDLACVQDSPHAANDTASGTEDVDVPVDPADLLINDTDPDNDTLTVTGVTSGPGGTATLDAGMITFSPDDNVCDPDAASFDYTIDDGHGHTDTGTVTVSLDCVNDNPVATGETVSADEDTATDLTAALLANDTDADDDTLSITDYANATGGTVDVTAGGLTFTPDAGKCGPGYGSFDYEVSDGHGGTDWATATVNVACVNDDPVAANDTASGTEDVPFQIDPADLVANDTDADDDTLTVTHVDSGPGGTATLDAGMITFSPDENRCDPDGASFDYTVDDGHGGTDTGTVTITIDCVNDAPVAADDTASGTEDTDVTVDAAALATASTDVEGDTLTVDSVLGEVGGTAELVGTTITFTPDGDLCGVGAASFDYTVTDGTSWDTGTVTIDLECTEDNPVATDDNQAGTEDTDLVISDLTLLTSNDSDVDTGDGDSFSITSVTNPTGGTVALVDGTITFTPLANSCDPAAAGFDYVITDTHAGTDTGHVTVTLQCVNDKPVAVDDHKAGTEDTQLVITAASLLGNDTDADDDTLTITSVPPATGGLVSYNVVTDEATFTPTTNLCGIGVGSFDYTVSDGTTTDTGHVTIDLTCVNDNPTAVNDVATVQQNSAAADHDVLVNDSDIDGDTPALTGASVDPTAHGTASVHNGKVSYTPNTGFIGTDVITYSIGDGHGGVATGKLTITVTSLGDITPPTAHAPTVAFATGRIDSTAPLRITWSATDASGVASYQVQVSIAGKPFSAVYSGTGTSIVKFYAFRQTLVFRVRATDTHGNTSAWATAASRKIVPYQNRNTTRKLTYAGTWHQVRFSAASGNGFAYTTVVRSRVSLNFNGRSVLYVAPRSKASGFVKVFVDGKLLGRFNLATQKTQMGRIIASKTWAGNGGHSIRIVNDQRGKRTNFDVFIVLK